MTALYRRLSASLPILLGFGVVALVKPELPTRPEMIGLWLILAAMYAQTTMAATLAALGSLSILWRVPLSLLWVGGLTAAFVANTIIYRGPPVQLVLVTLGACFLAQWLLVQGML